MILGETELFKSLKSLYSGGDLEKAFISQMGEDCFLYSLFRSPSKQSSKLIQ